jgi:L-asparaginase II
LGQPLTVIGTRGRVVETEHSVVYAVVRKEKVIDSGGDINLNRAMRSSAKLIQAIVCIETGAADAFGLTPAELAVIASSHNGNDLHVRTIRSILAKCGLSERYLQCGLQGGMERQTEEEMLRQGLKVKRIHHNCSGKHAGILASSKHMGWPLDTYRSPKHPWNKRVFELISLFTDIPAKKVCHAIDGCGVPVIFTPVRESAIAFARYGTPDCLPQPVADATRRIATAVNRYPYHNSGRTRFLAALYKAAPGRFVAKEGGQGVFCLGVLGERMGLAVKILDGRNYSYSPCEPALIHLMKRHGLLTRSEQSALARYREPNITNSRNEVVGKLKVVE